MASSYSTQLGIELIGSGDQSGTWGTSTNNNLGNLVEQAICGYDSVAVSTNTTTTITMPNGASGKARNMVLNITGTGGGTPGTFLEVPANKSKLYIVFNSTAGAVTVRPTGHNGVSVAANTKAILYSNGTDIVEALNGLSSLTLTGTAATDTQIFTAGGTTTGSIYSVVSNTSSGYTLGVEGSTGGTLISGAPAYAVTLKTATQPIYISTNGGTSPSVVLTTTGQLVLGNGDAVASPTTGAIRATSGLGTNKTGANLEVYGGNGTGTGLGGSILFYTSPPSTTGSVANTYATYTKIDPYGSLNIKTVLESATISSTAVTGTINYDALSQAVLYSTVNASGNWTLNVRGSSTVALDTIMQTGQTLTIAFGVPQGTTPYYQTALTVDGSAVTTKWQGGAPTSGNASSVDVYTMTILKTGSATFSALAAQTNFS